MSLFDRDNEELVRDYVAKRLTPEEVDEFEFVLFENAELVEMVRSVQMLTSGLELSPIEMRFQGIDTKSESFDVPNFLMVRDIPRYVPLLLFVAVFSMGFLNFQDVNESKMVNSPHLVRFSTSSTRGAGSEVLIIVDELKEENFIHIVIPVLNSEKYLLQLVDKQNGELVWKGKVFELSTIGDQLISIPSKTELNGDELQVQVWALNANGQKLNRVPFCDFHESCL